MQLQHAVIHLVCHVDIVESVGPDGSRPGQGRRVSAGERRVIDTVPDPDDLGSIGRAAEIVDCPAGYGV